MAAALRILLACLVQQQRLKDYLPSMAGMVNVDMPSSNLSPSSPLSPAPSPPSSRSSLRESLLASEDPCFDARNDYDPPVSHTRSNASSPEPTFSEVVSSGCPALLHPHDRESSATSQESTFLSADSHIGTPLSLSACDFKTEILNETWKVGVQELPLQGTEDHNSLVNQCSKQGSCVSQKITEETLEVKRNSSAHSLLEDLLHCQPTAHLEKQLHGSEKTTQDGKKVSNFFNHSYAVNSATIDTFQTPEPDKNPDDNDAVQTLERVFCNIVTPERNLKTNCDRESSESSATIARSAFSEASEMHSIVEDGKTHETALLRSATNSYPSANRKSLQNSNVTEYLTSPEEYKANGHSAYQEPIFSCHDDSISKLFSLTSEKVDGIGESMSTQQKLTCRYREHTKKSVFDSNANLGSKTRDGPLLTAAGGLARDTRGSVCTASVSNTCGKSPPGSPLNLLPFSFSSATTPRKGCVVVEEWKDDGDEEQEEVSQESERHIDNVENFYYDTTHLYHLRCAPETQDDEASIVPCGYPQGAM